MRNDNLLDPALETHWLGKKWHFFEEVDSTNGWLILHQIELAHGAVATADYQTAGKGRQGRRWVTPRGTAVAVSILLKPNWPAARATWLTMMAGVAAVNAIRQHTAVPVALKWPNDVIVPAEGGGWRKLGGILLEGNVLAERLETAVLGLGLNVNVPQADLPLVIPPATSLLVESGSLVARRPLLHSFLQELEQLYEAAEAGHSPHPAWRALLHTLGQQIIIRTAAGELVAQGLAEDVTTEGQLLVRDDNGRLHPMPAGDISLRMMGK